jgi:hypothetical protein
MMGRLNYDQGEFFYSFRLDEAVPDDHPVRAIAAVLDLSWVYSELAPFDIAVASVRARDNVRYSAARASRKGVPRPDLS